LKHTTLSEIELEDVLDSNVSVLTTGGPFDFSVLAESLVPLVHVDSLTILEDLSRLCTWVSDSHDHFSSGFLGAERILLFLRR